MNLLHAQIVAKLLRNAGYIDDANELLSDQLDRTDKKEMNKLITEINSVLPANEQVTTSREVKMNKSPHLGQWLKKSRCWFYNIFTK